VLHAQEPHAAAVADGDNGVVEHQAPKSRLWWFVQSSGVIGGFIFCLSMYFVATSIRLYIELRPSELIPPQEIEQGKALVQNRDFQGLYDFLAASESLYARITRAGLEELGAGPAEAREVMDRHAEVETVDLERKISILAVLGTLGPMIGLIGTLKGMITSFAVIALSDTQMKASEVAGGISEALLLTFEGVSLSIPAIYMYSLFRNRVTVYSAEALLAADQTIRRIVQASKSPRTHAAAR
jgi:biopolymer transport protein ExbB